jgi:hypothetical protein
LAFCPCGTAGASHINPGNPDDGFAGRLVRPSRRR